MPVNVEIKARCADPASIRRILQDAGAEFRGCDRQRDTYFFVPQGRLKLREGTIENHLIFYRRPDACGPRRSEVFLYEPAQSGALHALLCEALGVRVVVDKQREIYFVDNVKFHIDEVEGLGGFVEIEAIDREGTIGLEQLHEQCRSWMTRLAIDPADLIEQSYSEMLLARGS